MKHQAQGAYWEVFSISQMVIFFGVLRRPWEGGHQVRSPLNQLWSQGPSIGKDINRASWGPRRQLSPPRAPATRAPEASTLAQPPQRRGLRNSQILRL